MHISLSLPLSPCSLPLSKINKNLKKENSVLFHWLWPSLNLIYISQAMDIGFAMWQHFSKPELLNSLKNSSNPWHALFQCPCVRFRPVIINRHSAQASEVRLGLALGTDVRNPSSLLLQLLQSLLPPLIWSKSLPCRPVSRPGPRLAHTVPGQSWWVPSLRTGLSLHRPLLTKHKFPDKITRSFKPAAAAEH